MIYVDVHSRSKGETSGVLITFDGVREALQCQIRKGLISNVLYSRFNLKCENSIFIPVNNIDNVTLRDEILEYLKTKHPKTL